jgi:hypothetical protein
MLQGSSRWTMLWNMSRKIGSDSVVLITKLAKSPSSSRDILASQARASNSLATALLQMEKEVGLFRYHGFSGYFGPHVTTFRRRLGFASSENNGSDDDRSIKPKTGARVAFMITSAQRTSLSEELGYTEDDIRKMKPVEAFVILEHKLPPGDMKTKLPALVDEYHASLSKPSPTPTEPIVGQQTPQENNFPAGQLQVDQGARSWYAVVEIKPNSTETIGLYQEEAEAKLCLETKEHLEAKHNPNGISRFEIRITYK